MSIKKRIENIITMRVLLRKWDLLCHRIPYGVDQIFEALEKDGLKLESLPEEFQELYKEKKSLRRTIQELADELHTKKNVFNS